MHLAPLVCAHVTSLGRPCITVALGEAHQGAREKVTLKPEPRAGIDEAIW